MKAIDFCIWPFGFSVLSSNNTDLNITTFNLSGQQIWNRSYRSKNTHTAVGIGNDVYDIYIGFNEMDSGFSKVVMVNLDLNGQFKFATKLGGSAENCHYTMQSMCMINMRPRITVMQLQNNIPSLARISYSPTARIDSKEAFYYPKDQVGATLSSVQTEWSEVMAFSNGINQQSVYFTKSFPDNYRSSISSKKVSFPSPITIRNIIRSYDGGLVSIVNTTTTANDIVVCKTDSIVTLPGCGSEEISSSFTWSKPPFQSELLTASSPFVMLGNQPIGVSS